MVINNFSYLPFQTDTLPRDANMNNGTRTQRDMASLPVPLTNQTEPWTLMNDTVTPHPIHSVSLLFVWIIYVFPFFGKTISSNYNSLFFSWSVFGVKIFPLNRQTFYRG